MISSVRTHVASPQRSLRGLTFGIATAVGLSGLMLIALVLWIGLRSNIFELRAERMRIENALTQSVERTLEQQKTIAWWDDAVEHVANRFDLDFIDANFGYYFTETFGHDEVYILDAGDEPVYAFRGSARVAPEVYGERLAPLKDVVLAARGNGAPPATDRTAAFAAKQFRYNFLKGALRSAKWSAKITLIDGKPAIISAITIVPNVDLSLLSGRPFLLVTVNEIDGEFIDAVGGSLLIRQLQFTAQNRSRGDLVSEPFVTDDGQTAGFLTWRTSQPGEPLLTVVLPLLAIGVAAMWFLSAKMLRRLTATSAELAGNEERARHEASHDALSGLPNRAMFIATVTRELAEAEAAQGPAKRLVVGYLDIDRFKDINDTMGHHAGDDLICEVGRRLRERLDRDCLVARFGGDEFAILHPHGGAEEIARLSDIVAQSFGEPLKVAGTSISATASLGLAEFPRHGTTPDALMRHADIALYVAKREGRDQTVVFDAEMAENLEEARRIEVDLREALDSDQLALAFQPIVSVRRQSVVGVETLLRWNHPTRGAIPPSTFIPIAEESGLMLPLGDWILRHAFRHAARWPDLNVAINLSPAQFRHADLPTFLADLLDEAGIEASRITFEITEGLLLDRSQNTFTTLAAIRKMGFLIALDDFGTGFSSLKYLIDFRFDKLKIDRSFVTGLTRAKSAQTIIGAVVKLGRAMDMDVVAEGIETCLEATTMQALGCDFMQGYLFSRPLPPEAVEAFARSFEADLTADTPAAAVAAESGTRTAGL
ncbi:hypothetical protein ASG43_21810 [Aureimonas sp. Leaf454]|uniref:putative bifunctional diguanylate cyclase/phosphodiesterase n=1 Tax=Aureimonas sp. Leaf454 TaxID=1736381 RepID=UPI0006FD4D44|nr:bifunctional diguanylate cyclase/phosphodiesterase [Aureimonas sp. Leaf454]KQT50194.1 hypothetical protein ASG43_21810 [Aureimonas sp. Leaf454]